MADKFTVSEIGVIRESFSLFCTTSPYISSSSQLRCILRSLGIPITYNDSIKYFENNEGRIDMEGLLDIIDCESNLDMDSIDQIRETLHITYGSNLIESNDLARILTTTGEKLTPQEINVLFMQISPDGRPVSSSLIIDFLEKQLY